MILVNGSTDVTTYWVLRDSTTHAPKTSVTITDIDVYYVEQGAAISAKADLTALAAADSAHADNKGYEIGQGLYRIDWPDAAFDGGVGKHVILIVVCSGVDTTFLDVELSPAVNAAALGGTTQTGRDLGASVLLAADQAVDVTKWGGTAVASAYVQANTVQFSGQTITCAGGVTIPAATLASTANITAAAGCVLADSSSDAIIADAVWNAATASYGTSGTYGEALEAVGSAADPWLTNLPGSYGSGTAGYIVGTNLNATVSSRSSQTSVDTVDDFLDTEVAAILAAVDTEVAAIKAKTDNLPASPAAVGSAMTLANDSITADAIAASGANEIADALLDRDMSAGSDSGSATVRTPRQALRFLRNKWGVVGTDLTVCKEDDTATSWTATVTTSASAEPIVASDPASS